MTQPSKPSTWLHEGHTATHEGYQISCAEYEQLCLRAAGCCERCGIQYADLCFDHDHAHPWGRRAVRGLVCHCCNQIVAVVDRGRPADPLTAAYFAAPFHALIPRKRPRMARAAWRQRAETAA